MWNRHGFSVTPELPTLDTKSVLQLWHCLQHLQPLHCPPFGHILADHTSYKYYNCKQRAYLQRQLLLQDNGKNLPGFEECRLRSAGQMHHCTTHYTLKLYLESLQNKPKTLWHLSQALGPGSKVTYMHTVPLRQCTT